LTAESKKRHIVVMSSDEKRFTFTISSEHLALITVAAKAKGLTVAAWLRMLAIETAKKETSGKSRN
jgi:hypothetical protein